MAFVGDGNAEETLSQSDLPPGLGEMFINSTDTLRHREINQKIPETWNDRPPLFAINPSSQRRTFLGWNRKASRSEDDLSPTEQEDPNLLKGVSSYYHIRDTYLFSSSRHYYMQILTVFIVNAAYVNVNVNV